MPEPGGADEIHAKGKPTWSWKTREPTTISNEHWEVWELQ